MAAYGPDGGGLDPAGEFELPSIDELTGPGRPGGYPAETLAEVRHALGIGVPRSRYGRPHGQEPLPDVGELARDIGLHG
ncbi:MAG TPA: hypothetical protein VME19_17725 [Streptosporangiaceae bacterium]|nr:hypothetical protein [Streptosporangiaceae bacterium]